LKDKCITFIPNIRAVVSNENTCNYEKIHITKGTDTINIS
jgi:hypothetical protein